MVKREKERGKKSSVAWQAIGLVATLVLAGGEFWELIGILIGIALVLSPIIIPLVIYFRRKKHKTKHQSALEDTTFTTCAREKAFDEQSRKLFCFHKDKAEHHVARGKEIDPWDRPDIDISKYQRKE